MSNKEKTIGEIADIFDGPHATPTKTENGCYYLSISSLIKGRLDLTQSAFLSEIDFVKWTKRVTPVKGDILFSYETRLGEAALMPDGIRACLGRRMGILRPKGGKVISEYLLYAYLSPKFQHTIVSHKISGSTVDRIALTELPNFPIRIPSIQEQILVAELLISLDSKIALNNRINTELEAMAKTLYDYWFVQFDFPVSAAIDGVTPSHPVNDQPLGYKSSGGKMVWNEELKREVPEGWKKGTLSDLGEIIGGSTPPREVSEYFTNDGIAWITPKDLSLNKGNKFITKGELDVSDEGKKAASLNVMPKGTILLSSRAPIGYLAISREIVTTNQGFKSFVPNKGYSTEYVYYSIMNMIPTIENNAVGSTFKEVSASTLKSIFIILAGKAIINKYTETVSSIFNRQDLLEKENIQLASLRDWLLPMLMNGQVVSTSLNNHSSTLISTSVDEMVGLIAAEPVEKYGE
ncbi:MAG: restriction endonuclease subunit S [Paludibacter sp.]